MLGLISERYATAIVLCLLAASSATAGASQDVRVLLRVPGDTPADATIYLAGSLPSVGNWKADGVALARQPDGTYAVNLKFDAGQTLEFKFNRGSWDTVEKTADGGERANRSVTVDASTTQIEATVDRWANGPAAKPASTVVGRLELHTIESKALGKPRTIRVWLPAKYASSGETRFDVLYLHDGQNLFDRATSAFGHEWEVDETLTKLIAEKTVEPILVVGIDNGGADRINELTYAADKEHGGGHAAAYARFVIEEVMPFVAAHYRVNTGREHTLLGGSSLGGLVSLEIARRNPAIFGGVLAMSPSLWWPAEPILPALEHDASGLKDARVWLDMGTAESSNSPQEYVDDVHRADAALTKQGVAHRVNIEPGAVHNEEAWAKRFGEAIEYLLAE